jgi:hypothetical protein
MAACAVAFSSDSLKCLRYFLSSFLGTGAIRFLKLDMAVIFDEYGYGNFGTEHRLS